MGLAEEDESKVFSLCILLYFCLEKKLCKERKKKFSSKLKKKRTSHFIVHFPLTFSSSLLVKSPYCAYFVAAVFIMSGVNYIHI